MLQSLRESELPAIAPKVIIVREGDALQESRFFWHLIEDRAQFNGGTYNYSDFMQFVSRPPTAQVGMGISGPIVGQKPPPGSAIGHSSSLPGHRAGAAYLSPMAAQGGTSSARPAGPMPPPPYVPAAQPAPIGQLPPSPYHSQGQQTFSSHPSSSQPPTHGADVGQSPPSQVVSMAGSSVSPPAPPLNTIPPHNSSLGLMQTQVNRMVSPPVSSMQQRHGMSAPPPVSIRVGHGTVQQGPPNMQMPQVTAPPPPMAEPGFREALSPPVRAPSSLPNYLTAAPPVQHIVNAPSPSMSQTVVDIKHHRSDMGPPPPPQKNADASGPRNLPAPPNLQHGRPLPPPPIPIASFTNSPYQSQPPRNPTL